MKCSSDFIYTCLSKKIFHLLKKQIGNLCNSPSFLFSFSFSFLPSSWTKYGVSRKFLTFGKIAWGW